MSFNDHVSVRCGWVGWKGLYVNKGALADWPGMLPILNTPFFSVFLVVRRFIEICKISRGDTNEDCWKYYGVAPYKNNRGALSWVLIWP